MDLRFTQHAPPALRFVAFPAPAPSHQAKRKTLARIAVAGVAAFFLALLAAGSPTAMAAGTEVTLGPSLPTAHSPGGAGLLCFSAPTCTYFTERSSAFAVPAPAAGKITSWSVENFSGSAELAVLQPESGGRYSVVAQSAKESEPCTGNSNNEFCIPVTEGVYTFPTDLPIAAGQQIGIDALNSPGCEGDRPIDCTIIGDLYAGDPQEAGNSEAYLNPTPALNTPTVPTTELGSVRTVDAVEQIGSTTTTTTTTTNLPPTSAPCASLLSSSSSPTPFYVLPSTSNSAEHSRADSSRLTDENEPTKLPKPCPEPPETSDQHSLRLTAYIDTFALEAGVLGADAFALGVLPEPTGISKVAATATGADAIILGITAGSIQWYKDLIAQDPFDPAFAKVDRPQIKKAVGLKDGPYTAIVNKLAVSGQTIAADIKAIYVTLNRANSAKQMDDTAAFSQQETALSTDFTQLRTEVLGIGPLQRELLKALGASATRRKHLTAKEIKDIGHNLKHTGLPSWFSGPLAKLGVSKKWIAYFGSIIEKYSYPKSVSIASTLKVAQIKKTARGFAAELSANSTMLK